MDQSKEYNLRFKDNRVEEFMRLYQTNELKIYGFIRSLVPNWNEADDLAQNTTIVLWSKFDDFEIETNFVAWALKIARFEVKRYYKKRQKEKNRYSEITIDAIADKIIQTNIETSKRHEALHGCIDKLKEKERKLVNLRYEVDATTATVAKRLSRSVDTVYKALNIIHAKLLICIRRTLEREEML